VSEVVTDGVTGFIVDSIDEAVRAVGRIAGLSRRVCRRIFEERFDAARMARDYVDVYRRLVHRGSEGLERVTPTSVTVSPPRRHGVLADGRLGPGQLVDGCDWVRGSSSVSSFRCGKPR
jgi:hypothetical protein